MENRAEMKKATVKQQQELIDMVDRLYDIAKEAGYDLLYFDLNTSTGFQGCHATTQKGEAVELFRKYKDGEKDNYIKHLLERRAV